MAEVRSPVTNRNWLLATAAAVAAAMVVGVLTAQPSAWRQPAPLSTPAPQRPVGGEVNVAVETPPQFGDRGSGGQTLADLTLPKLFEPQPDGTWQASIVEPGSDSASADGRSARFRLRDLAWSNGVPVGADDLARTADDRYVESVSDADNEGFITVRFTERLTQWRSLWSLEPIAPPALGVTAGPFRVANVVSGLHTELVANNAWFEVPNVDLLRLVVVPDVGVAQALQTIGQLDVVPTRLAVGASVPDASGDVLVASTTSQHEVFRVAPEVDRSRAQSLASELLDTGYAGSVLGGQVISISQPPPGQPIEGQLEVLVPVEMPLAPSLGRALEAAGERISLQVDVVTLGQSQLRQRVDEGRYQVALDRLTVGIDPLPSALGGTIPLWQPQSGVVIRPDSVQGVVVNGHSSSKAWGAQRWWVSDSAR